eukprot:Skav202448  [mRNA]  locus=scaffold149:33192:36837:- [translate_table: standard]
MRHDAALREGNQNIEGPLIDDQLLQLGHLLRNLVILNTRLGVKLLLAVGLVSFRLLCDRVHVPVFQLGTFGQLLLHVTHNGLSLKPVPILSSFDEGKLTELAAQGLSQRGALKLQHFRTAVTSRQG